MRQTLFCLVTLFLINQHNCSEDPDIFSSVTELAKLAAREQHFYQGLQSAADQLEKSAKNIRAYLKHNRPPLYDSRQSKNESLHQQDSTQQRLHEYYVGNPINALNLVKRLSSGESTLQHNKDDI